MRFDFSVREIRLETSRLLIRPWQEADLQDFHDYARTPGLGEMAGWPHHKNLEETRNILKQFMAAGEVFALYHKGDHKVIGSLGVHDPLHQMPDLYQDRHVKEIGYALSKDYWGQGLMVEAVRPLIAYLFQYTPARLLCCCCLESNRQSSRVMEKAGFTFSRRYKRASDQATSQPSLEYLLTEETYRTMKTERVSFLNDYNAGCHPAVLDALNQSNEVRTAGYGLDPYCQEAAALIREACQAPQADVHFLVGGTQVNLIAMAAGLKPWQGVLSAGTGHINVHEAGAIEATGHKVLVIPSQDGRIGAEEVDRFCRDHYEDASAEHMVQPGMVYLSQPTELGTVYTLEEVEAIRQAADRWGLLLFVDGARLASSLALPSNSLDLPALARLADFFTIGGTKCGALFGEALVLNRDSLKTDFRSLMKQRGGLLAKGRLLGLQFGALFRDGLYEEIGRQENAWAAELASIFRSKGVDFYMPPQTNQLFVILDREMEAALAARSDFERILPLDPDRTVCRFVTSYATRREDLDHLFF